MKEISVSTVADRMNRILAAFKDQTKENGLQSEQSTSMESYSTERGLESYKSILKYATDENVSDSDQSDSIIIDSPPRRRQPQRAVKRTAKKTLPAPLKRKQRKLSATITSKISSNNESIPTSPENPAPEFSDSEVDIFKHIKNRQSLNVNDNDNRPQSSN